MKLKRLGNGSAFNSKMTNSSFLFDLDGDYLLVDCGHSVFAKLRDLDERKEIELNKLKYIFITHMDDDHIGSLRTLMYYLYFTHNIVPYILCHDELSASLKTYLINICGHNAVVDNYEKKYTELFSLVLLTSTLVLPINGYDIWVIDNKHYQKGSGVSITSNGLSVIITGDTVANHSTLKDIRFLNQDNDCLIFHDLSNWDCPEKQVHASKSNLESIYPNKLMEYLTYYHNDTPFLSGWIDLSNRNTVLSNYTLLSKGILQPYEETLGFTPDEHMCNPKTPLPLPTIKDCIVQDFKIPDMDCSMGGADSYNPYKIPSGDIDYTSLLLEKDKEERLNDLIRLNNGESN